MMEFYGQCEWYELEQKTCMMVMTFRDWIKLSKQQEQFYMQALEVLGNDFYIGVYDDADSMECKEACLITSLGDGVYCFSRKELQ